MKHLDWRVAQSVKYCLPHAIKNEHIRLNTARVKGRIEPHEKRDEPIAIACFGPSLNDTWEKIREFKYVMSCSGSHKFLVERGIIPTWHCDVDPREHKVGLMGQPQKETTYLVASTCHPKLLDHLEGYNVLLWHVFDTGDEADRVLPRGDWAVTGGCSVGLRTMTLAGFLGFRDIHMFGMDGSAGLVDDTLARSHATDHPNYPKKREKYAIVEYEGKEYLTTPGMLEAARQTWHELDQMPGVHVTFYGEGLVQAMAKTYQWKEESPDKPFENVVAISKPELISAEYLSLQRQLHQSNPMYGVGGGKHAETVIKLADAIGTRSILDYGCGRGYLGQALAEKGIPIWEYDPAVPGKDGTPRPADLLISTDMLEHVERDRLLFVLDDMRRCTKKVAFVVIHTGPSSKTLADGRNAHLIQEGRRWWENRLKQFFVIGRIWETPPLLCAVLGTKSVQARVASAPESTQSFSQEHASPMLEKPATLLGAGNDIT